MPQNNFLFLTFTLVTVILTPAPTFAWRSAGLISDAYYGKPCTNGTVPEGSKQVNCDREAKSLVCSSSGKCECAPSDKATIYDAEMQHCVLIPYPEDDFRCTTDFQCHVSSYGRYSRCNLDQGKCECFEEGTQMELRSNVCYSLKSFGASESYSSCQFDDECWKSDLGNLTRCNLPSLQCECYDTVSNGKNDVGYYQGRCVIKKMLGNICESDAQCKVSHGNSFCAPHGAYLPGEKTCQCPPGDLSRCEGDGGSGGAALLVGLGTVLLGVVAIRVVG